MAGNAEDDPMSWGCDRVIMELCTSERTWTLNPPGLLKKWPDTVSLASRISEEDVDGLLLLTSNEDEVLRVLGVQALKHRTPVRLVLQQLRARSREYRAHKKSLPPPPDEDSDVDMGDSHVPEPQSPALTDAGMGKSPDTSKRPPEATNGETHPLEPANKKQARRMVPINISAVPVHTEPMALSNDADFVKRFAPPVLDKPVCPGQSLVIHGSPAPGPSPRFGKSPVTNKFLVPEMHPAPNKFFLPETNPAPVESDTQNEFGDQLLSQPGAYLGDGKLFSVEIYRSHSPGRSPLDSDNFGWGARKAFAPGRRQQVGRVVKNYLLKPNVDKTDDYLEAGDELIPQFGESEDEDQYDEETWAEIQEEERERERQRSKVQNGGVPAKQTYLNDETVKSILKQIIEDRKAYWRETKLPKYQPKAFGMWSDAHKHGTRKSQVANAQADVRRWEARLAQICDTIRMDEYKSEAQLRTMSEILDQTVFPREYALWVIGFLNSPTAPARPPARPRGKRPPKVPVDSDGETLTSDSEPDQHDDFILNDMPNHNAHMEIDAGHGHHDTADDNHVIQMETDDDHGHQVEADDAGIHMRVNNDHGNQANVVNDSAKAESENMANVSFTSTSDGSVAMFDLTHIEDTPQRSQSSQKYGVVDLVTPTKLRIRSSQMSPQKFSLVSLGDRASPAVVGKKEPSLDDPEAIANMGIAHWQDIGDWKRLIITLLWLWPEHRRRNILQCVTELDSLQLWDKFVERAFSKPRRSDQSSSIKKFPNKFENEAALSFTRLFDHYTSRGLSRVELYRPEKDKSLSRETVRKVRSKRQEFDQFCQFLRSIAPYFRGEKSVAVELLGSTEKVKFLPDEDVASDDDDAELSPSKNRRKQIVRDKAAQNMRQNAQSQAEDLDIRRRMLREKLANDDSISHDRHRLIINESKQEHEGLLYVNDSIGRLIKDHQIEGVRFMWNQVVSDNRQGCLLAHTMGLGKTMQIITLLVAIAEAAQSEDLSISCQVPEHLQRSSTLILCPAGLVQNWCDELLMWAPQGVLGRVRKVVASQYPLNRAQEIRNWKQEGGVLVMGYPMLDKAMAEDELESLVLETPNIVIGDEAHNFKNPTSKRNKAANGFSTTTRIALTGSPLANNVEEYHSMLDWVAPNYLGPLAEFREIYAKPIKEGLYKDSWPADRRKALKMLKVLKDTVKPKVHRKTVAAIKGGLLPPKKEFILYLAMQPLQQEIYQAYVQRIRAVGQIRGPSASMFTLIDILNLLISHPKILRTKLETKAKAKPKPAGRSIDDGNEDDKVPAQVLNEVLSLLPRRGLEDYALSYKMSVLVQILSKAKDLNENTLVFSQHLPTLDYIENLCRSQKRDYFRIDGSTDSDKRQTLVKDFNMGKGQVFLISTKSGGEGLNLHGASRVVIFDSKFNPISEQQAIGRAYRIGQTKEVTVYWLICDGTFEKILQNQSVFKLQLQSRVVDQKNPVAWAQKIADYFRDPQMPEHVDKEIFKSRDAILKSVLDKPELIAGITSIESTDTFDEQEPEEQLTFEERVEADRMIKLNQLRLVDPDEHARQVALDRTRLLVPMPITGQPMLPQQEQPVQQALSVQQVLPVQHGLSVQQSPPSVHTEELEKRQLTAEQHAEVNSLIQRSISGISDHLTPEKQLPNTSLLYQPQPKPPANLPSLHSVPTSVVHGPVQPQTDDTGAFSEATTNDQTTPGASGEKRPRAAVNQAFAEPSASVPLVDAQHANKPIMATGTGFRITSASLAVPESSKTSFESALKAVESTFPNSGPGHPRRFAPRICSDIEAEMKTSGGLERVRKWRQLNEFVKVQANAKAILDGRLSPTELVRLQPEKWTTQLRGGTSVPPVPPATICQRDEVKPNKTRDDPDHARQNLHRSLVRPKEKRSVHAKGDMIAMQEFFNDRDPKQKRHKSRVESERSLPLSDSSSSLAKFSGTLNDPFVIDED